MKNTILLCMKYQIIVTQPDGPEVYYYDDLQTLCQALVEQSQKAIQQYQQDGLLRTVYFDTQLKPEQYIRQNWL